jgi:hypothetical protein
VTASEIIVAIGVAGGAVGLTADGQRVRCRLPRRAESLLDEVRQHRDDIFNLLKDQEKRATAGRENKAEVSAAAPGPGSSGPGLTDTVSQWLHEYCVAASCCASNPRILHREYSAWLKSAILTYEEFLSALRERGWLQDRWGKIRELCLGKDFWLQSNWSAHGAGKC